MNRQFDLFDVQPRLFPTNVEVDLELRTKPIKVVSGVHLVVV